MLSYAITGVYWVLALCALIGAVEVLFTRDDAFTAADRKPKMIWAAILGGSSFAVALSLPFLSWIGIVMTGLYWFDVRPQIKNIISGNW
ncbi:DUF2516 family protein [Corynebacterium sp. ES2794-CONJ1]|uniref:DUF2516 family protein n=1 Tax=unclassified Corynebacterium TaxID=2624378 RepID=UPI0021688082|nr:MULTISPECIES: DUF2516 family protein [unclassified Corynebacterium]MCS4491248.1 DUF2516 family protein [Corynebacterium sp. ES2715-CONJ3]MCS4531655.1 DUF2516 family protein [Corynebacterium sp. ES2730-CONJ]MCU9519051.1 DUF2516 family protein [Corynebacterium sp. ES2794-CONJ1]